MTSSCWFRGQFAVFARGKWWKVLFESTDHCILCWPCCWLRCWMFQDMDHMEAGRFIYVKVGRFDQLNQSKIRVLTITLFAIVMLTVYVDFMFTIIQGRSRRCLETNITRHPFRQRMTFLYLWNMQYQLFSSRCIPVNKQITSDQLMSNLGTIGNPCSYTPCSYTQCSYTHWSYTQYSYTR
jgi:hypothetical protein